MTTRARIFLAGAMLAVAAGRAFAQAPLSITLEDAIRRGLETAPSLAAARAQESAAKAEVDSRMASVLPSVRSSADYMRTNHVEQFGFPQPDGTIKIVFPDIPNNYRVRTEMTMPILPVSMAKDSIDSARAGVRATQASTQAASQDLRLQIAQAYWALATARESVRVLDESLQRMEAFVGDVRARVDAGVLGPNDLLTAEAQRARQSVQRIQAQNAAALAEIELDRLVGAPPGQTLVLTTGVRDPFVAAADLSKQPPADLLQRALTRRPERQALQERAAAFRKSAEATSEQRLPRLDALAAFEPARPNPRFAPRTDTWRTSWEMGVMMTWTLFDGGRARALSAQIGAQAGALDRQVEEFDALVGVEIRQRLQDLESSRLAVEASATAVAAATEARRVTQERFNAGVATNTDVLDAQLAMMEAELEQTRLAAAARLAEARLLHAVGAQ